MKTKICTSIEQSRELIELGLDPKTADMYYWCADHYPKEDWIIEVGAPDDNYECICAWSLAALLGVLPDYTLQDNPDGTVFVVSEKKKPIMSDDYDNPVDACVAMIETLYELKMM